MSDLGLSALFSGFNTTVILSTILVSVVNYIPRLIIALVLFLIGRFLANSVAKTAEKILSAANLKHIVASFQLGLKMSGETEQSVIHGIGILLRSIVLYAVFIIVLQVVGLTAVADFFIQIVDIIPRLLSSLLILTIGVIIAGFIESLLKKALIVIDPATARLSGKVGSYVVVSFFALMALAELGLAETFVNTLFIGMVATIVLAFGLAFGLGSKDLVREVLLRWYERRSQNEKSSIKGSK